MIQCGGGLYPDGAAPKRKRGSLLSHRGLISQGVKSPWPNSHHHNCTPKYSICHMNRTSEGIMGFHHVSPVAFPKGQTIEKSWRFQHTWPTWPSWQPRFFHKLGIRVSYGYPDVFFGVTSERRKKKHTWLWFLDVPPWFLHRSPSSKSDPISARTQ